MPSLRTLHPTTMPPSLLIAKESIQRIRRVAGRHGITHLRVFGSQATGRARFGSDLDLLVDVAPGRDLLDLVEFKLELEDFLGCEKDVDDDCPMCRMLAGLPPKPLAEYKKPFTVATNLGSMGLGKPGEWDIVRHHGPAKGRKEPG